MKPPPIWNVQNWWTSWAISCPLVHCRPTNKSISLAARKSWRDWFYLLVYIFNLLSFAQVLHADELAFQSQQAVAKFRHVAPDSCGQSRNQCRHKSIRACQPCAVTLTIQSRVEVLLEFSSDRSITIQQFDPVPAWQWARARLYNDIAVQTCW